MANEVLRKKLILIGLNANSYLNRCNISKYLPFMKEISKYGTIGINYSQEEVTPTEYIDVIKSFEIARNFLKTLDPELLNIFDNLVKDKERFFIHINKDESSSACFNGIVILNLKNTINDVYSIIHEFIHKLYLPINTKINSKETSILSELPSLYTELLLNDYIIANYPEYKSDCLKRMNDRFNNITTVATMSYFHILILELIIENKELNPDTLMEKVLGIEDEKIKNKIMKKFESFYVEQTYQSGIDFMMTFSYVFGIISSAYIKNNSKNDVETLRKILILSRDIHHKDDLGKLLKNIDLKILKRNSKLDNNKLIDICRVYLLEVLRNYDNLTEEESYKLQ